ncbi:hypothetical protein ACVIF9_007283 [Bradyrhizobium sp. USDA 4350]
MIDLAVLDAADRRHGFDRGADHETRRGRTLAIGPEAAAQSGADEGAHDVLDRGAAATIFLRRLQFIETFAVGLDAAGDEQLRDQFVLGAEMIVHRREVDVRLRDDVAQRDVAEAAVGIEPLGGGENGGSGLVAGHGLEPFRYSAVRRGMTKTTGSCISNICMKLSFEEPEMSIR